MDELQITAGRTETLIVLTERLEHGLSDGGPPLRRIIAAAISCDETGWNQFES